MCRKRPKMYNTISAPAPQYYLNSSPFGPAPAVEEGRYRYAVPTKQN